MKITKAEFKTLLKECLQESIFDAMKLPENTEKVLWKFDPEFRKLVLSSLEKYDVGFRGEGKALITYDVSTNDLYHVSYLNLRNLNNDPLIGELSKLELEYLLAKDKNKDSIYQSKIDDLLYKIIMQYKSENSEE